jgi:hypothetical protein
MQRERVDLGQLDQRRVKRLAVLNLHQRRLIRPPQQADQAEKTHTVRVIPFGSGLSLASTLEADPDHDNPAKVCGKPPRSQAR